jgi:hypothetical protein
LSVPHNIFWTIWRIFTKHGLNHCREKFQFCISSFSSCVPHLDC